MSNTRVLLTLVSLICISCVLYAFRFDKSMLIGYITDFLTEDDFKKLKDHCASFAPIDEGNHIAPRRTSFKIPLNDMCYMIMNDAKYISIVNNVSKFNVHPTFDPPMEYRVYPKGAGMKWHTDVVLFDKPQLECVFTIDNSSDSVTQYKDRYGIVHSLWTQPNSLMLLLADDVEHHVTSVESGQRSILKYVYTYT